MYKQMYRRAAGCVQAPLVERSESVTMNVTHQCPIMHLNMNITHQCNALNTEHHTPMYCNDLYNIILQQSKTFDK